MDINQVLIELKESYTISICVDCLKNTLNDLVRLKDTYDDTSIKNMIEDSIIELKEVIKKHE